MDEEPRTFWLDRRMERLLGKTLPGGDQLGQARNSWTIIKHISENRGDNPRSYESVCVWVARQEDGPEKGTEAILKTRIQLPSPDEYQPPASVIDSYLGFKKIRSLKHLTEVGCTCTPRLWDWGTLTQQDDLVWLPGGFILYCVMEKLPGHDLTTFWEFPLEKRDRIRAAFRLAEAEFSWYHMYHGDNALRNLLWDEESDRCYIIDHEQTDYEPDKTFLFFDPGSYDSWNLVMQHSRGKPDPAFEPWYKETRSGEWVISVASIRLTYPEIVAMTADNHNS